MIVSILDPGHLSYIVAPDVINCGGDNCSKLLVFLPKDFLIYTNTISMGLNIYSKGSHVEVFECGFLFLKISYIFANYADRL